MTKDTIHVRTDKVVSQCLRNLFNPLNMRFNTDGYLNSTK